MVEVLYNLSIDITGTPDWRRDAAWVQRLRRGLSREEVYMDWKAKLDTAKTSADQETHRKIEENWPKVQQIFQEKVGPAALAAAQDDASMTKIIIMVYESLPFPFRMVVKQEVFVEFCLRHRDRLVVQASGSGA
jgi:hypothetical protein